MYNIPSTILQHIYEYGNTYKIRFDQVLKQLSAHCFIYNCHKCFKPWNNCYCYCVVCKAYLILCQQMYYDEMGTYEDELENIIVLSGWFKNNIFIFVVLLGWLNCILKEWLTMINERSSLKNPNSKTEKDNRQMISKPF